MIEEQDFRRQSDIDEEMIQLAWSLGHAWPEDDEGRWECLKHMASRAAYWRQEAEKCKQEITEKVIRERMYEHQQEMLVSLRKKVKNLRRALKDYMAWQSANLREAKQEIFGHFTSTKKS